MYSLMHMNEKILKSKLKVKSGFDVIKTNTKELKTKSILPSIADAVVIESEDVVVDEAAESL